MKKMWYKPALAALVLGLCAACSDDDGNTTTPPGEGDGGEPGVVEPGTGTKTAGMYVLNTGNWGGNDATIQYFNLENLSISGDLFGPANGAGLGDLGQDLCLYGSKLYATVSGSSKLEVMDRNCKVIKTLHVTTDDGQTPAEPRYMTACGGNVYFTAYDGTVSRLDTASLEITGKVAVGDHPEALTNANGKLYVNISGYGTGATVAVVDVASFTKTKDIAVKLNPYTQCFTGDDGYVYTVSNGNYAGSPGMSEDQYVYGTLQRIDPATDTVEDVCRATFAANHGDKMYVLYSEYYLPETKRAFVLDLKTGEETDFLNLGDFSSPNAIGVNPSTGDVYVADTPYGVNSTVRVYDAQGKLKNTFEAGYSTSKFVFVNE